MAMKMTVVLSYALETLTEELFDDKLVYTSLVLATCTF